MYLLQQAYTGFWSTRLEYFFEDLTTMKYTITFFSAWLLQSPVWEFPEIGDPNIVP